MANCHLDLAQLFLFQISQRLQTGPRKRTKNKLISSQSCEQGVHMQWTKGTNYIVKTPMLHYRVLDTRQKSHYGNLESHISQVI